MTAGNNIVILLVGRTGDGKSAVGNELLKRLGNNTQFKFVEGDSAYSQTSAPIGLSLKQYVIVDNPGLMDTDGIKRDEENIGKIVAKAKELGHLNMLVLVMNAGTPRFDDAMQSALKLISDSFGKASLNHLFVLYTNRYGNPNACLEKRTSEVMESINKRCETNLRHLTYYAVENYPENYRPHIVEGSIGLMHQESYAQLDDLLRAARTQGRYSTKDAIAADYEHVRLVKQAEMQRAAAEEARTKALGVAEQERIAKEAAMVREAQQRRRAEIAEEDDDVCTIL
jgi:hypothetical protein